MPVGISFGPSQGSVAYGLDEVAALFAPWGSSEFQQLFKELVHYYDSHLDKIHGRVVCGSGIYSITRGAAKAYCIVHGMNIPTELAGASTIEELLAREEMRAAKPPKAEAKQDDKSKHSSRAHQEIYGFIDEAKAKGLAGVEASTYVHGRVEDCADLDGSDLGDIEFDNQGKFKHVQYFRGIDPCRITRNTIRKMVQERLIGAGSLSLDSG